MDFSFLEDAVPKHKEPAQSSGWSNVTIRVDADCMLLCDGEYIDVPLKAGIMTKTQLPIGQHLLEFISVENSNIKIEKTVDFPESNKNYLVLVTELKGAMAPPMPHTQHLQATHQNEFLDRLTRMAQEHPLDSLTVVPPMPK